MGIWLCVWIVEIRVLAGCMAAQCGVLPGANVIVSRQGRKVLRGGQGFRVDQVQSTLSYLLFSFEKSYALVNRYDWIMTSLPSRMVKASATHMLLPETRISILRLERMTPVTVSSPSPDVA